MATVQNARDTALQVTSPRLTDATLQAVKSVVVTASASVFQVDNNVASPTSITFTATLRNISGTVTWSTPSGTATLTGSGNSRTLTFANLTSSSATIRATISDNGTSYTSEVSVAKVLDGAIGARGVVKGYGSAYGIRSSVWSDAKANRVISNVINNASSTSDLASTALNRIGDEVALSNTSPWIETKGNYAAGTTYYAGQLVVNAGNTIVYRALQETTGNAVTNATYWAVFANVNSRGAWANATSYALDDMVSGSNAAGTSVRWVSQYAHTSTGTFASERDGGGYVETRYWGGSAWLRPGYVIPTNLLVMGDISGGRNIDIYGRASFEGATATSYGDACVTANSSLVADIGVVAFAGNTAGAIIGYNGINNGYGTIGYALSVSTDSNSPVFNNGANTIKGTGVYGEILNGNSVATHHEGQGVWGKNTALLSANAWGVRATGGFYLESGTFKWGTESYSAPDGSSYKFLNADGGWASIGSVNSGASTGTFVGSGKPGSSTNSVWLTVNIGGTLYDLAAWPRS